MLQSSVLRVLGIFSAIVLAAMPLSAQTQGGTVTGTVTSSEGQPLGAVQVTVQGTTRGSITRTDGTFSISNVPAGTHTVLATSIGYQQFSQAGVNVSNGASVTVNPVLQQNVLALQGIVVTGLVDPIEGTRSPITVAQVTRESMPVSAASADPVTQLQGKVAGATIVRQGGQPGQDAQVRLRTPTSALGSARPLYVVDGVILGTDAVDIDSSDIESIEVVKGAAAASLYGSRAASGVIAITTNRGRGVASGSTRFSANNEIGFSEPSDFLPLPTHHQYRVNANNEPINAAGQVIPWAQRQEPTVAFMENDFPAGFGVYDNLATIYRPGTFNTQNFSLTSNSDNTNLAASVNRLDELGAIEGNQGYERNAFRMNVDHRFRETLQLGLSAYHSRAFRDDLGSGAPGGNGGLLGDFFSIPAYVDLSAIDPATGTYPRYSSAQGVQIENPIWRQMNRDNEVRRARTLGNATLRWSPLNWFSSAADVSFDREDSQVRIYVPKGIQDPGNETFDGRIRFENDVTDTFNGSLQASINRDFGPLNSRTTVRGIMERVGFEAADSEGQDFRVFDVQDINAANFKLADSETRDVRSTGYLVDQAFDYDGKYIFSALARRDGSSLFGEDNRWHNYYRVAGAWLISEESWFNVPAFSTLKLKGSRGTAGGRPTFYNQYETFTLTASGITKGTLGNRDLRPEHTTENEFGIEAILFDKMSVELVHARQTTEHQLVDVNLPGAVGYTSQWINAGTLKGNSTELVIEARVIDRDNFTWTTNVVGDRARSEIAEWPTACRIEDQITYLCAGTNPRDIYGFKYANSVDELPSYMAAASDQFEVNDDGFVVWVGAGNDFTDGRTKNLWGTSGNVGGVNLAWGNPVLVRDESAARNPVFGKLGSGDPDFQLGWMNTVTWNGFTAHAQLHTSIGGEVYNMTKHYSIFDKQHPILDQADKPMELRKPVSYYVNGQYNGSIISSAFVENASFLKLRTLSLTYDFSDVVLSKVGLNGLGADGVEVGIIGRNIFTVDNYSGFDPEVVSNNRLTPLDNYVYPNLRNYTFTVGVTF